MSEKGTESDETIPLDVETNSGASDSSSHVDLAEVNHEAHDVDEQDLAADSALTLSMTTLLSSGRSDDSGADVAKLDDKISYVSPILPTGPSHGPTCHCLKCITIMQVDGNNELSDSDSSTSHQEASKVFLSSKQGKQSGLSVEAAAQSGPSTSQAATQAEAQCEAPRRARSSESRTCHDEDSFSVDEADIETQLPAGHPRANRAQHADEPVPGPSALAKQAPKQKLADRLEKDLEKANWRIRRMRDAILDTIDVMAEDSDESHDLADTETSPTRPSDRTRDKTQDTVPTVTDLSDLSDIEVDNCGRCPRVRKNLFGSESTISTDMDSTDYSDDEDIRNFFMEDSARERFRAKNNPLFAKEKREPKPKPDTTEDILEMLDSDHGKEVDNVSFMSFTVGLTRH